jgi:hypothetical protein
MEFALTADGENVAGLPIDYVIEAASKLLAAYCAVVSAGELAESSVAGAAAIELHLKANLQRVFDALVEAYTAAGVPEMQTFIGAKMPIISIAVAQRDVTGRIESITRRRLPDPDLHERA